MRRREITSTGWRSSKPTIWHCQAMWWSSMASLAFRTWAESRPRPERDRARPGRSSPEAFATSDIRGGSDYPLWATEITPVTGKWRIETVEINGDIQIAGVRVAPGDIVVADETGVCFIPIARAAEILAEALKKANFEAAKCEAIDAGTSVADLPGNAVNVMIIQ